MAILSANPGRPRTSFIAWLSRNRTLDFMLKIFATAVVAALIVSCSTASSRRASVPKFVVGITASSKFSGWGLNWCSEGEPVKNLYSRPEFNCSMLGGEIHIVRVKRGVSLSDMSAVSTFDVLVPVAIDGTSPHGIALAIEPAPADLVADTGVRYWARYLLPAYFACPDEKPGEWSSQCLDKLRRELANVP
jgi:hypothetical protein